MSLLKDLIVGAVGYGLASSKNSKVVGDIIDNNINNIPLEDMIDNYARRHLDIYTFDNKFAHRLHKIAKKYEGCNYDEEYGDKW